MPVEIRQGAAEDFDAAVAVFIRSNLARRQGVWPHQALSVARLEEGLRRSGSWLLVAEEGAALVGMALAEPMRDDVGAGAVIADGGFLGYLYVVPDRWGEGIGGRLLDAVLEDARTRSYRRIRLWTHADNERSHSLYLSRGFSPTGRVVESESEWAYEITHAPPPQTGAASTLG